MMGSTGLPAGYPIAPKRLCGYSPRSKKAGLQGHFCEAVHAAAVRSTGRQHREGLSGSLSAVIIPQPVYALKGEKTFFLKKREASKRLWLCLRLVLPGETGGFLGNYWSRFAVRRWTLKDRLLSVPSWCVSQNSWYSPESGHQDKRKSTEKRPRPSDEGLFIKTGRKDRPSPYGRSVLSLALRRGTWRGRYRWR